MAVPDGSCLAWLPTDSLHAVAVRLWASAAASQAGDHLSHWAAAVLPGGAGRGW